MNSLTMSLLREAIKTIAASRRMVLVFFGTVITFQTLASIEAGEILDFVVSLFVIAYFFLVVASIAGFKDYINEGEEPPFSSVKSNGKKYFFRALVPYLVTWVFVRVISLPFDIPYFIELFKGDDANLEPLSVSVFIIFTEFYLLNLFCPFVVSAAIYYGEDVPASFKTGMKALAKNLPLVLVFVLLSVVYMYADKALPFIPEPLTTLHMGLSQVIFMGAKLVVYVYCFLYFTGKEPAPEALPSRA